MASTITFKRTVGLCGSTPTLLICYGNITVTRNYLACKYLCTDLLAMAIVPAGALSVRPLNAFVAGFADPLNSHLKLLIYGISVHPSCAECAPALPFIKPVLDRG